MVHRRLALLALALSVPITSFAATAKTAPVSLTTTITKQDILTNMVSEPAQTKPTSNATFSARPAMNGGSAGGVMMDAKMSSSMIMPYYGNNGVNVDVQVTRDVHPDVINLNAWCQLPDSGTRDQVRTQLDQMYQTIKTAVGNDGRIRRQGGYALNPVYDPSGKSTNIFQGNLNVLIRITKASAAKHISDAVESVGCNAGWDVRMKDMQTLEMSSLDELVSKLNSRKQIFEKLLGKKLTVVQSASLNTYIDGYSSYDPETNTAEATTNLNVVFDVGGRVLQPTPVPMPMTK